MQVVLVDDDDEVRRTLRRVIGACGCKVTDFATARDALLHLDLRGADLLITDLEMPGMDGAQLAATVSARRLGIRVIVISGRDAGQTRARLVEVGDPPVAAIAEKPIPLADMRRLLAPLADAPPTTAGPSRAAPPAYPTWEFADDTTIPAALQAVDAYWARQRAMTKPAQSLGRLEHLGAQLAALQRHAIPACRPAVAMLFASDHPVADLGVSAYPMAVTRAMVANLVGGGAAASVLCRLHRLPLQVIDVGVAGGPVSVSPQGDVRYHRTAVATMDVGNLIESDAMAPATFLAALEAGSSAVAALPADTRMLVVGEMGIGNSTCAAAVSAALLAGEAAAFVGPGTGVTGASFETKVRVVDRALARARAAHPGLSNGLEIMRMLGGRDLAAMMAAMATAISRGIAVLVDGYIATAAALALLRVAPLSRAGLIFAHASREPGHRRALEAMGFEPLVHLDMALGEGSGALVAWPIVDAACALVAGMATFRSADVPERQR